MRHRLAYHRPFVITEPNEMSYYTPINRETLAASDAVEIERRYFPTLEADPGDVLKITASDGAVKEFRVVMVSKQTFHLRALK